MGVMGDWRGMSDEDLKVSVAAKMLEKLKKGLGDNAPTRVEVASNGGEGFGSGDYVLFNFHYDNDKAQDGHNAMNHDWALAAIECGGHGSSCIPHGDNLVQASMQGVSLQRLNYDLDKRQQLGSLAR